MISLCMVWRRDDPKQSAIEAILAGAKKYKIARGQVPNFVNTPPGFLSEAELAQLRERLRWQRMPRRFSGTNFGWG